MRNKSTRQSIALAGVLLLNSVAASAAAKEAGGCVAIKEADKRLECYDRLAQAANGKAADRDNVCNESVLSRLGGGLLRSFPRQRELL